MAHDPIPPDDWALVHRYFLGDASADDVTRAEAALAREPRLRALRAALRTAAPSDDLPLVDFAALKHRIDTQRHAGAEPPAASTPGWSRYREPRRGPVYRRLGAIVAGVAAVAAMILAVVIMRPWQPAPSSVEYTRYATGNTQIAHVTLDDGTAVTLAPNTTLRVARPFVARRDVRLTGEAYFDVVHANGAPFVVHTGAVTTRVLGTTFDVRRYAADRETRVVVMSGRVVATGHQGVTLAQGGVGYVTDSTATATTVQDAASYGSWTSGALAFREVPAADMLETVGRWYDLHFQFADSTLARKRLVATFATGETRADALELISTILDATLTFSETRDGKTVVTLHPRTARRESAAPAARFGHDSLILTSVEVGR